MSETPTTHDETTDGPTVTILEATENPERVACMAARNDYMSDFVGEQSFEETMASVDGDTLQEKKENLIHHMLSRGHFGPLEHPQITFAVKGVSRSLMAQITRHRHASFDVLSQRYVSFEDMRPGDAVVSIPELTDPGTPGRNASFSDEWANADDEEILRERNRAYQGAIENSFHYYRELLALGVAPEEARKVLPIGTKVNLVMSVNLRMLLHIGDMRAAGDAQSEIADLTFDILELAKEWSPIVMDYYLEEMHGRKNRLSP